MQHQKDLYKSATARSIGSNSMMRPAGENLQSIQGKALAEVAPRPNMRAGYASLVRPGEVQSTISTAISFISE